MGVTRWDSNIPPESCLCSQQAGFASLRRQPRVNTVQSTRMPAAFSSQRYNMSSRAWSRPQAHVGTHCTSQTTGDMFSTTACCLQGVLKHMCFGVTWGDPVLQPPPLPPDSCSLTEGLLVSFDVQMNRTSAVRSPVDL